MKFYGMISLKCHQWLIKKLIKYHVFASLCVTVLFAIVFGAVAALYDVLYLLFLLIPLLLLIISCLPFVHNEQCRELVPTNITFQNGDIYGEGCRRSIWRSNDQVKAIYDWGAWYSFDFYFPNKNIYLICQKDLIVEGTIEEFEKLFEGKIIRKLK